MAKNLDWANLPFGYMETNKSFVSNWKDGAWDEGTLTSDHTIKMSECAGVLQYAGISILFVRYIGVLVINQLYILFLL